MRIWKKLEQLWGMVRKIKIYRKEVQKMGFDEFGKILNLMELELWGKVILIEKPIYKKEIWKIVFDKFGKT